MKQKAGSPLARLSMWDHALKQEVFYTKKNLTMTSDRVGSNRTALGCQSQTTMFGDISLLLENSEMPSNFRKSLDDMLLLLNRGMDFSQSSDNETKNNGKGVKDAESTDFDSSDDEPLIKKAKRYRTSKEGVKEQKQYEVVQRL